MVAALVSGITTLPGMGHPEEYNMHLEATLDCRPDAIIDDGQDLVALLHKTRQRQASVLGAVKKPPRNS